MTKKICLALLGVFSCLSVFSQEKMTPLDTVNISFGDHLPASIVNKFKKSDASWMLKSEGDLAFNQSGKATDLAQIEFVSPGIYQLDFSAENHISHIGECDHHEVPTGLVVLVSSIRFQFVFEEIKFSQELKGGADLEGLTITIPVIYESYVHQNYTIKDLKVIGSGVNNLLNGKLSQDFVELIPGKTTIVFTVSGSIEKGSYIMLDFTDPLGKVQTYYHPIQII